MSYDLIVYCTKSAIDCPPQKDFEFEATSWSISVDGPMVLESEDVPAEIDCLLPGIAGQYDLHLTLDAPKSAFKKLQSSANALARECQGLVYDPQLDDVIFPKRITRYRPLVESKTESQIAPKEQVQSITLGFWFIGTGLDSKSQLTNFVHILQRLMPEAIPRRYGTYEPMQGNLERDGIGHFIDMLGYNSNRGLFFGVHGKPVHSIELTYKARSWSLDVFHCHYFGLRLTGDCLKLAGWRTQVERTFKELISFLKPFYAEINIPTGRYGPRRLTQFRGLPPIPKYAAYYGKKYVDCITQKGNLLPLGDGLLWLELDAKKPRSNIELDPSAKAPLGFYDDTLEGNEKILEYPAFFPFEKQAVDWGGGRTEMISIINEITRDGSTRQSSYNTGLLRFPILHHRDAGDYENSTKKEVAKLKQNLLERHGSKFGADVSRSGKFKWNKAEDNAVHKTVCGLFSVLKATNFDENSNAKASSLRYGLVLEITELVANLLYYHRPVDGNVFMEIFEWPYMYENTSFLQYGYRAAKMTKTTMSTWLVEVMQDESADLSYRIIAAEWLVTIEPKLSLVFMRNIGEVLPPDKRVLLEGLVEKIGTEADKDRFYTETTLYWKAVMDY